MKIILIASISLDGKIAQTTRAAQSSLDWNEKADTENFIKITKECGVMIMGSNTFKTIGKALKDRLIIVMAYPEEKFENKEGVEFTSEPPIKILEDLKKRGFNKVAIAGGGQIYNLFLKENLVDELFLTIAPVLFGNGLGFTKDFERIDLNLIDVKKIGEKSALLHYEVKKV